MSSFFKKKKKNTLYDLGLMLFNLKSSNIIELSKKIKYNKIYGR